MVDTGPVSSRHIDINANNVPQNGTNDSNKAGAAQNTPQPQAPAAPPAKPQTAHRSVPQTAIDDWVSSNHLEPYYLQRKAQLTQDAAAWSAAHPNRPAITADQIDRAIEFEERRDFLFARGDQMGREFQTEVMKKLMGPMPSASLEANLFGKIVRTSIAAGSALIYRDDLETIRRDGHRDFPSEALSDYRHAFASYTTANEFGVYRARFFGAANEMQGLVMHDVTNLKSRLSGQSAWAFQFQDLSSNEVGFMMSVIENLLPESR